MSEVHASYLPRNVGVESFEASMSLLQRHLRMRIPFPAFVPSRACPAINTRVFDQDSAMQRSPPGIGEEISGSRGNSRYLLVILL